MAPAGSHREAAAPHEVHGPDCEQGVIGDIRTDARWDARHDERSADRVDARVAQTRESEHRFRYRAKRPVNFR
jgi:hypothetical protein